MDYLVSCSERYFVRQEVLNDCLDVSLGGGETCITTPKVPPSSYAWRGVSISILLTMSCEMNLLGAIF